jgi:hypothetical protein
MKWWYFDDNRYGTIVFRPKIVNSISTADAGRGRGLAVGLKGRARMQHGEPGEIQEFTHYTLFHPLQWVNDRCVRLANKYPCWPISLKREGVVSGRPLPIH